MRLIVAALMSFTLGAQTNEDAERGKRLYLGHCAPCHGPTATGGRGPNLTQPNLKQGSSEEALFNVIRRGVPGTEMPGAWQMTDREVRQVVAFIRSVAVTARAPLPGNPARGEQLYKVNGCGSCHIARGEGTGVGPELTSIGAARSADFLRRAMTDPAADVPDRYAVVKVTPLAGPAVTGARVNEDAFTIQIRSGAGRYQSFRRSALKSVERLPAQSAMPSYKDRLNATQLDDIVAYLAGLRGEQ